MNQQLTNPECTEVDHQERRRVNAIQESPKKYNRENAMQQAPPENDDDDER
jgi:hypothetical protein